MDNFEYNSPPPELQISTESIFISEYGTTMNPLHIPQNDKGSESAFERLGGMGVYYVMCGALILCAIFSICYRFCMYLQENAAEQEAEHRRLNQRVSHRTYGSAPMIEGIVFNEDSEMPVNPNEILPRLLTRSSHSVKSENRDIKQGQEAISITDLHIPFCTPQQIIERNFFLKGSQDILCRNTAPKQVAESSCVSSSKPDNHDSKESKERIFYPEDFLHLKCPNSTLIEKRESMRDEKSQECANTPLKRNVSQASPGRRSRISPTSPDLVRRRVPTTEGTPQRPSSWQ